MITLLCDDCGQAFQAPVYTPRCPPCDTRHWLVYGPARDALLAADDEGEGETTLSIPFDDVTHAALVSGWLADLGVHNTLSTRDGAMVLECQWAPGLARLRRELP